MLKITSNDSFIVIWSSFLLSVQSNSHSLWSCIAAINYKTLLLYESLRGLILKGWGACCTFYGLKKQFWCLLGVHPQKVHIGGFHGTFKGIKPKKYDRR